MKLRLASLLAALLMGTAAFAGSSGAQEANVGTVAEQVYASPAGTGSKTLYALPETTKTGADKPRISEQKAIEIVGAAFPDLNLEGGQPDISLENHYYYNRLAWNIRVYEPRPGPSRGFNATVDAETGEIIDFSRNGTPESGGERILSREEAQRVAEDLARRLQPAKFGQTRLQTETQPQFLSSDALNISYRFFWSRHADGLKINEDGIGITVDALSGLVTGYNFRWQPDLKLPGIAAGVIPAREAAEKMMEKAGMSLVYHVPEYEYNAGTPRARLVYQVNSRYPVIMDAVSGKLLDYEGRPVALEDTSLYENIPAASGDGNLPAPGKDRISVAAAMEKAGNFFRALGYEGEVERRGSGSSSGPWGREEYWTYGLRQKEGKGGYPDYLSVGVEVFSGRVNHFHGRDPFYEGRTAPEGKAISREEAVKIARQFIQRVEPGLAGYLALEKEYPLYDTQGPPMHYLRFVRVANGVVFPRDGINISVDYTGKIVNYNCRWLRVDFPPATAVISAGDAARKWLDGSPLTLQYFFPRDENQQPKQPLLVYQAAYNGLQYIDANTGEVLRGDGRPLGKAAAGKYDFTGNWAAQQLELMADSGLLPPPEEFSPNSPVTRRDGIRMLLAATGSYYGYGDEQPGPLFNDIGAGDPDFSIALRAVAMNMLEKGGSLLPDEHLTRSTLAAWLVNSLGYRNVTLITNRIESPFKDIGGLSLREQNCIGLANGLGLLTGDGSGYFRPDAAVTWEELSAVALKAAPKLRNRTMWY